MGEQLRELIEVIKEGASALSDKDVARRCHPAREAAHALALAIGRLEVIVFEIEAGVYDRILSAGLES